MKMWKKEKKVVALLTRHTDEVRKVLNSARTALDAYLDDQLDPEQKMNEEVDRQESKADNLRREIQDTLFAGAYLPHLREDIFQLVESVDGIADSAEACIDFFTIQRPEIPDPFKESFRELITAALGNFDPLRSAIKGYFKPKGKLEELRKYCSKVGKAESRVDTLEEALSTEIFKSDLELSHKMHLQACISIITQASDRAEDAADLLVRVGAKSVV